MNKVCISGYGCTKFSHEDSSIEKKMLEATKALFDQTPNISQKDIDVVLVSTNDNTKYLSAVLSEIAGIEPKISHTVESLCNSGTNTIVSAYSYLASGLADVALVVGAERYDSPGQILEWDQLRGEYKHPIYWASIFTKSYKREFGANDEDLAIISVKNHRNAQDNPYAYSKKAYSVEEVLESKSLTDDLRLLDCSRPCTGSSAILLSTESASKKISSEPIIIKGVGQKTVSAGFTKNPNFSSMISTQEASDIAYKMAKRTPKDVNVAEVHDAFTVCEPMALEGIGFSEKGKGIELTKTLFETEDRKINPRGGLIGSGHPLGATGIAQTIEVTQQLQGKAKNRQIQNAKTGLVHNMSAAATSSTILLLES